MQEGLSNAQNHRTSAIMLLRVLSCIGTLEQARALSLKPPLRHPAIPDKPEDSCLGAGGDKALQGNQVSVDSDSRSARTAAKAIGDMIPPGSLVPNAGHRTMSSFGFEALQRCALERLLDLLYGLVVAVLKRKVGDLRVHGQRRNAHIAQVVEVVNKDRAKVAFVPLLPKPHPENKLGVPDETFQITTA